jgi:glycosyltransferase involved in cell wall biosynthesis
MKKDHNSLILIGPLPPPAVGQSLSFQMLCMELRKRNENVQIIDIGGGAVIRKDGAFSIQRAIQYLVPIIKLFFYSFKKKQIVYLTIAQSWNGFLRDFIFIGIAIVMRHKIVVHLKGGNYDGFYKKLGRIRQFVVRHVVGNVNSIIVLSESLRGQFDFLKKKAAIVKIVHNGLPENYPESIKTKDLPKNTSEGIQLLYLSNMIESKGYLHVLHSVHRLNSIGFRVFATFCGEFLLSADTVSYTTTEEAKNDFYKTVECYKLTNSIQYLGPVNASVKINVLERAHFFILPTLYINEGQPISIIEAMAFGCVVVSTRYRSIPEMLDYGNAGILLDTCDSRDITFKIAEIIQNREKFRNYSCAAINRFNSCFSRDAHIRNILKVIYSEG